MPLMFAVSIGATVSLVAITMFGLAWYEYESRVVLNEQVLTGPTHDEDYNNRLAEQEKNLGDIDQAIDHVVTAHGGEQGQHHGGQ
ncbi:MAG: hypothetical protein ACE37H_01515 [Phycisphaeraceae bacterium]